MAHQEPVETLCDSVPYSHLGGHQSPGSAVSVQLTASRHSKSPVLMHTEVEGNCLGCPPAYQPFDLSFAPVGQSACGTLCSIQMQTGQRI